MNQRFERFARQAQKACGSPYALAMAVTVTLIWLASGPFFGFSDTWQLVYNTISTLSTGLIVFIIQGAQNRFEAEVKLQLSELTRAVPEARSELAAVEDKPTEEIERLQHEIAEEAIKAPPPDEPATWLG